MGTFYSTPANGEDDVFGDVFLVRPEQPPSKLLGEFKKKGI